MKTIISNSYNTTSTHLGNCKNTRTLFTNWYNKTQRGNCIWCFGLPTLSRCLTRVLLQTHCHLLRCELPQDLHQWHVLRRALNGRNGLKLE